MAASRVSARKQEGPMKQRWLAAVAMGLLWVSAAPAQETNWQFRWQKGQVLTYKADHKTNVEEVAEGAKVASASKLSVVKRWQVIDVDAKGSATIQLTLAAMRNEQTRPNGEVLLFDSANPDKGTPELKEQMSKFIGQTLAVVRIDIQGRVLEVKQGSASRYEIEPPFVVVFPAVAPKEGLAWLRPYTVTLDPPYGTGEKLDATQKFQCTKIAAGKATLTVANQFKALPENVKDQVPLVQKLTEGQIVFDIQGGRVVDVQLNIDRTLMNHQGEGSSYHFQSWFTEQLIDVK
jgi:hypothetical protein